MLPKFPTPDAADYSRVCRVLVLPRSTEILSAIASALTMLTDPRAWVEVGTMGQEEASQIIQAALTDYFKDRCMIGTIVPHVMGELPDWMIPADGSIYLRGEYPDLYDLIDPSYRIDAVSFRVPDLRGRTIIGTGNGPLTTDRLLNEEGGTEYHTLTVDEMPAHSHDAQPHSHTDAGHTHGITGVIPNIDIEAPGVPDLAAAGILPFQQTDIGFANIQAETVTIEPTGKGEPHNNMMPYLALNYAIVAR
jgi:microcystin-dependent protein